MAKIILFLITVSIFYAGVRCQPPIYQNPSDLIITATALQQFSYPQCVNLLSGIETFNTILNTGNPFAGMIQGGVLQQLVLGGSLSFTRQLTVRFICSRFADTNPPFCRNFYDRQLFFLTGISPDVSRFCYPPCQPGTRCIGNSFYQQCTCIPDDDEDLCQQRCHPLASCTPISRATTQYRCVCPRPYRGDGVNSCRAPRRFRPGVQCRQECHPDASCVRSNRMVGEGRCRCKNNYTGDGVSTCLAPLPASSGK